MNTCASPLHAALRLRGWSGWTRDMSHVDFLLYLFLFFVLYFGSSRACTSRPILTIFTSYYDVFPHKDVPFGGRVNTAPNFGGQIFGKTHLGRELAFSSRMRKILKLAYYQNYCTDYNQILHNNKDYQILFLCGPHAWNKSKLANGCHLEKSKIGH